MPFIALKDLRIGTTYVLTEYVDGKAISAGEYVLVKIEETRHGDRPRLGFSRLADHPPQVFLQEAHAQFGDDTWRHAFKTGKGWDLFWPIGARSWNQAWVEIAEVR